MTARALQSLRYARRAVLGVALSGALATGYAAEQTPSSVSGAMTVGLRHVMPEYKGGMKFRTPESIDIVLAQDVARRLGTSLRFVSTGDGPLAQQLATGKIDFALVAIAASDPLAGSSILIPAGYAAAPMAILRSDTDIRRWEHLRGRKVCVSEGSLYAGTLASRYGAIEKVQKAPADSLLAVRVGACDAAVHDSAMLDALARLPEWKKFSARLPAGPALALHFVVPRGQTKLADSLRQITQDWKTSGYPDQAMQKAVRHIAFEVYLDQDVPDCH